MKMLLLAQHLPPAPMVSAHRAWGMAKYLARRGWSVTVVTPDPRVHRRVPDREEIEREIAAEWEVQRRLTSYRWPYFWYSNVPESRIALWFHRVLSRLARRVGIDPDQLWIPSAEEACATLRADDVDVILATGGPWGVFGVAERLAQRLGKPLVLDYRDSWTDNAFESGSEIAPETIAHQARLFERAAAITTVSPTLASLLVKRGAAPEKVHVVTNGFDPERLAGISPKAFSEFAIVYTGRFYGPIQTVEPLFAALKHLEHVPAWRFHYYGAAGRRVCALARRHGIERRVVINGAVGHRQALAAIAGADLAVVITSVRAEPTARDLAIVTGKLFEPIGLRRPILLIAPRGSDAEAIAARAGFAASFAGTDIEGITCFLQQMMFGAPALPPRDPDGYAWPRLAEKLDGVLRGTLEKRSTMAP
jgi:glycosyltransferase involved in cell wall biosynthesis